MGGGKERFKIFYRGKILSIFLVIFFIYKYILLYFFILFAQGSNISR